MTNNSIFLNDDLVIPMAIGAIVVWILFIYKELPFKSAFKFLSRLLVATLVIACLLMIVLVPMVERPQSKNQAILLTENFSQDIFDSIRQMDKELNIISYKPNTTIVPDSMNIGSFIILGNGIESYDLWQMKDKSAKFFMSKSPNGIIDLNFPEKQSQYSDLLIEGSVRPRQLLDRLILENPNSKVVDSLIFNDTGTQKFSLKTTLKVSGNFVYTLIEKDSTGNVLSRNPIPVQIVNSNPLKILMLVTYPSFESKYLKNFLTDNNNQVVSRTQITRGRYKFEYFDLPRIPILQLNSDQLENFDLVISDKAAINSLSNNEFNALQRQIIDNGLGLLYLSDNDVYTSEVKLSNFEFEYNGVNNTTLDEGSSLRIDKYPYTFKDKEDLQIIHQYKESVSSASHRIGLGKVGTTMFKDTYQLLLKGQDSIYKTLWTKVIRDVSKEAEIDVELQLYEKLNFVDEPMPFKIRTVSTEPKLLANEGYRLPLKQDLNLPYVWSGLTYPRRKGWQSMTLQADSITQLNYYVFKDNDWEGIKINRTIALNNNYFNEVLESNSKILSRQPINLIFIYLLALIGLGYLWLVPKLGLKNL